MYISLPRGVEVGKEVGDQEESMWEVQLQNAECTHTKAVTLVLTIQVRAPRHFTLNANYHKADGSQLTSVMH